MFARLLGGLPRPPLPDDALSGDLVGAAIGVQEAAGLEPLVDGGLWGSEELGTVVERWHATAALTDRAVKAVVLGPWSATPAAAAGLDADALEHDLAMAADARNAVLRELAAAGCPLVEVHEPGLTSLGLDPQTRRRFVEAQRRVLDGLDGLHASLAITGGSAEDAGIGTLLGAPYSSLALDLVRGPDNWRIAAATPRPIGIVCGALTADADGDEAVEILLYALNYAASTAGRGPDRVGVATAGSLADVPWEVAERRMHRLGEAVRLAVASPDERAAVLDPRAISIRSAALGRAGVRRAKGRSTGRS
jgi:methionine synthase II (cobalamin-independent)